MEFQEFEKGGVYAKQPPVCLQIIIMCTYTVR